jgi:hypothetical protein
MAPKKSRRLRFKGRSTDAGPSPFFLTSFTNVLEKLSEKG